MKVFISGPIPIVGIHLLEQAGIGVTQWTEKRNLTKEELIIQCQQFDALINIGNGVNKRIDAEFLQACKHLKVISLYSVGFDGVDIAEATRLKIPIGNTPGASSEAVADIAFFLMLAVSRKALYYHKKIINNQWGFSESTEDLGFELQNKTLGVWGLGRIGFEMAKRCIGAYNMNVIYCNNKINHQAEKELHAIKVSFDELLAQSDVLTVHVNLTPETENKFNKNAFQKMKKRAIFINTSRGAIHNESDLIAALEKGHLWGAGLDVTNPEPMLPNNPLLAMPNVAVLPHIGSATEEARNEMAKMVAANTIAGLQNKRIPFPVNPEIYF